MRVRSKWFLLTSSFCALIVEWLACDGCALAEFARKVRLRPSGFEFFELETEAKIARQMTSTAPTVSNFEEIEVVIILILSTEGFRLVKRSARRVVVRPNVNARVGGLNSSTRARPVHKDS
jgi:hypothetical protein